MFFDLHSLWVMVLSLAFFIQKEVYHAILLGSGRYTDTVLGTLNYFNTCGKDANDSPYTPLD